MKSVVVHALLAAAGLAVAYQTWTREAQEPTAQEEGQALIFECAPDAIERFSIETPTNLVSFVPERSEGEPQAYWVTTQRKPKDADKSSDKNSDKTGPAGDGDTGSDDAEPGGATHVADEAEEAAEPEDEVAGGATTPPAGDPAQAPQGPRPHDPDAPVEFLADADKFASVVARLTPLRAVRSLGEVAADKVEVFGFDDIGTRLRVECGGKQLELGVGGRTYGSGHRYAKHMQSGQAYLVDGRLLMDLQSARVKFMQSEPHGFAATEVDEARVQAHGLEKHLLLRDRKTKEASWVDAAAPDRRNELYGNWFQRLSRLKIKRYLPEGAGPGSDLQGDVPEPAAVLTIDYGLEGKPQGKLELVRVDAGGESFYYARTETTRRWTTMYDSMAKQVAQEAALVVGAEEAVSDDAAGEGSGSAGEGASPAAQPAPGGGLPPHGHPPIPGHGNPHAMPGGPAAPRPHP